MPKLKCILETALYVKNLPAAEKFYSQVLGLPLLAKQKGRHLFYWVGRDVLLIFYAPKTLKDKTTPHGAKGPGHLAFEVSQKDYGLWKKYLTKNRVKIVEEVIWKKPNFRSIYFRDPSGNLLEIATPGIWEKIK
ncbi:MAG: VOC family protein [candidate division Zixibacteria bacterium]|nr:VOC family protein [candidate division Zixibacteria bacterium]